MKIKYSLLIIFKLWEIILSPGFITFVSEIVQNSLNCYVKPKTPILMLSVTFIGDHANKQPQIVSEVSKFLCVIKAIFPLFSKFDIINVLKIARFILTSLNLTLFFFILVYFSIKILLIFGKKLLNSTNFNIKKGFCTSNEFILYALPKNILLIGTSLKTRETLGSFILVNFFF